MLQELSPLSFGEEIINARLKFWMLYVSKEGNEFFTKRSSLKYSVYSKLFGLHYRDMKIRKVFLRHVYEHRNILSAKSCLVHFIKPHFTHRILYGCVKINLFNTSIASQANILVQTPTTRNSPCLYNARLVAVVAYSSVILKLTECLGKNQRVCQQRLWGLIMGAGGGVLEKLIKINEFLTYIEKLAVICLALI